MNREQISFADIRTGDKLLLEGGYTTSQPVTALKLERIPEDAGGPYAGQWAWYFIESAPLVGQRCFVGETLVYRVLPEDEYEYNIRATDLDDGEKWLYRETWEPNTEWLEKKLEGLNENADEMGHTYRLVKRRKAGRIEEL